MKAAVHKPKVVTIPAGEFKAKCLSLFDEVEHGSTIIVTKRGRVVAHVVTAPAKEDHSFIGAGKGRGKIIGDIVSALPNEWEAEE